MSGGREGGARVEFEFVPFTVMKLLGVRSFNSVQDWCTQIKTYSWENAQVVLVGNKCDMDEERVVSRERGKQLADQLGKF